MFFGGGTPSILQPYLIVKIMEKLKSTFTFDGNCEISIECNPGTVDEEKLTIYKNAGINRISFGLQSTENDELKAIGRIHTFEDFLVSFKMARKVGFNNINIDMMSALPNQTMESYEDTVNKIIALNPEHISAYSLILEEGTPMLEAYDNDNLEIPDEDTERRMYYLTEELMERAGYVHYEISNYGKRGYECKHNLSYWERVNYLGFGIGAASLLEENRYSNIRDINKYINVLSKEQKGTNALESIRENIQSLDIKEQMEEFMFLGLRKMEGVSQTDFRNRFGMDIMEVYKKTIDSNVEKHLLSIDNDKIYLTPRGIDISNTVMAEFLFD